VRQGGQGPAEKAAALAVASEVQLTPIQSPVPSTAAASEVQSNTQLPNMENSQPNPQTVITAHLWCVFHLHA
jgi:hypothetical protein